MRGSKVLAVALIVVGGLLIYSGFTGDDPRTILAETFAPQTLPAAAKKKKKK